jgi:uncharacterized protein
MRRFWALILIVLFLGLCAYTASLLGDFRIEASSDSMSLADDPGMEVYDKSRATFGNDEYVFVTVTRDDLFTDEGVAYVRELAEKVAAIEGIRSALSMVDIPLFRSTKRATHIMQLRMRGIKGQPRLGDKSVILEKARTELTESKVYSGSLVTPDGKTAAVLATFEIDPELNKLMDYWVGLKRRIKKAKESKDPKLNELKAEFKTVNPKYRAMETNRKDERVRIVNSLRQLINSERKKGHKIEASGLPMIIVDMVNYIAEDLKTFGLASIIFLGIFLLIVFQRIRWVLLPLLTCAGTALFILGLFVLEDKRTTVVTCNIPSLLLIIGLAHTIHIIIRFQEHSSLNPTAELWTNLKAAMRSIITPCFYTALTTGVGFLSLMTAGILPVKDFGFHMGLGVGLAFLLSFVVFPAGILLTPGIAGRVSQMKRSSNFLGGLARFALRAKWGFLIFSVLLLGVSIYGTTLIKVETRFIDYFRKSSPIYKSLSFIDRELGGTTQFDIILRSDKKNYFKTKEGLAAAEAADVALRKSKVVGNVAGLLAIVDECQTVVKAGGIPKASKYFVLKQMVPLLGRETLESYVTEDWQQIRVTARIHDTAIDLDRNKFISDVETELKGKIPSDLVMETTGIFVIYTNMLNSLAGSQYKTALSVFGLIFFMMLILLRNVKAALLCMIPNALPIVFVLGLMGLCDIHLDMATVMIASISLGIAIDGTIHYTVRFRDEYAKDGDAEAAVQRSHESIGIAIFYTTLTCIVGFWVLALSNFVPNIYFGIFTGVAMLASLFGALTILPITLALVKPFKGPTSPAAPEKTEGT